MSGAFLLRRGFSSRAKSQRHLSPKNIILVRHGMSAGNLDERVYAKTPDWRVPLTEKGWSQAREAGRRIAQIIEPNNDDIILYTSPYKRARQTAEGMFHSPGGLSSKRIIYEREEPRIREQDFGNLQTNDIKKQKKARRKFSKFFYRFQNGESGADVYDRVSSCISSLFRDWADLRAEDSTAIIVTHGITARLFVMRWFHWSVKDFEETRNPPTRA